MKIKTYNEYIESESSLFESSYTMDEEKVQMLKDAFERKDSAENIFFLLTVGAKGKINKKGSGHLNAMILAVDYNRLDYLEYTKNILGNERFSGYLNAGLGIILNTAMRKENVEIIEFLLKNGANPKEKNYLALILAAKAKNQEILEIVLKYIHEFSIDIFKRKIDEKVLARLEPILHIVSEQLYDDVSEIKKLFPYMDQFPQWFRDE